MGLKRDQRSLSELLAKLPPTALFIELNYRLVDKFFEVGFGGMTESEKVVYLLLVLEGQVDNGGFAQFFFNSTGEYANEVPWALEQIGAPDMADLMRNALTIFPDGITPPDIDERNDYVMNSEEGILSDLTNQFHSKDKYLEELQIAYICKNIKDFESID